MLDMRRREFITLLGGAAAWPLAARAQQPAMPVIGVISAGSRDTYVELLAAFRQGLKQTGYVEDQTVAIDSRWAEGQNDRLPALAADLVKRHVAVIIAPGPAAAKAAKAATTTIPIVFISGDDPVRTGLVSSITQPGRNITGVMLVASRVLTKRVEMMYALVPGDFANAPFARLGHENRNLQHQQCQQAFSQSLGVGRHGSAGGRLSPGAEGRGCGVSQSCNREGGLRRRLAWRKVMEWCRYPGPRLRARHNSYRA